jgi:hypothetical protein
MPRRLEPQRSYMTAEELCAVLRRVFGDSYQAKFAAYSGLSKSQVNRYANGLSPIPKPIVVLIATTESLLNSGLSLPALKQFRVRKQSRGQRSPRSVPGGG